MNFDRAADLVNKEWDNTICESLSEYIKVPNQSPLFDDQWASNGLQEKAIKIVMDWVTSQNIPNLAMRLVTAEGRTPVIFMEIPGTNGTDETILMYGHVDKQPPMLEGGWIEGTGPYTPVIIDGKLYGRGGADDGYSTYASITALKAVQEQGLPHARIVVLIEACEESGSKGLKEHIEELKDEIGNPSLVICLDSGAGNYDQLWLTATLRGMMFGVLEVKVTSEGVHSGSGSGIIPSSFRIARDLLDRIEDSETGEVLVKELWVDIPEKHKEYAKKCAEALGNSIITDYPFLPGVKPVTSVLDEALLNKTWRPTVSYTGISGIPSIKEAGNVLRPSTSFGLSFRLPPTCDPIAAYAAVKAKLEANPPYGAHVTFNSDKYAAGWMAPPHQEWLDHAVDSASLGAYKKPAIIWGEGGSIPFMGMLGELFPETQFVITGVLGPKSNAHGPNEFMHIEMFKNVTVSMASIITDHYKAKVSK